MAEEFFPKPVPAQLQGRWSSLRSSFTNDSEDHVTAEGILLQLASTTS